MITWYVYWDCDIATKIYKKIIDLAPLNGSGGLWLVIRGQHKFNNSLVSYATYMSLKEEFFTKNLEN